jgi:NAD(P)-dependent dehydrogenase (short-subunit alcohol dehydrogenase family)
MGSLQEGLNTKMPFFNVDIKAYDSSKAAVNMLALNYKRLLADKGGLVNAV